MLVLVIWIVFHICSLSLSLSVQQCRNSSSVLLSALIVHQLSFPSAEWTRSLIDLLENRKHSQSTPSHGISVKGLTITGNPEHLGFFFFFVWNLHYVQVSVCNNFILTCDLLFSLSSSFKDWPIGGSTNKKFDLRELFSAEHFFCNRNNFDVPWLFILLKIIIILFGLLINHKSKI